MRIFLAIWLACWSILPLQAGEGMWLPTLLGVLNEAEMQSMGLEITAEDIYSINQSSLKDAVVNFDNKCTGSIISDEGLLLTNFHCGPRAMIRALDNAGPLGFWAKEYSDELPMPGVTATFIVRMDDVTESITKGMVPNWTTAQRQTWIAQRSQDLIKTATEGTHYRAQVKEMFGGGAYYLILQEEFLDVRLVGAPPESMGEFGGDTDNWVWPRHTTDFSLFRIYTDAEGKPAPYAGNNIPFKSKRKLDISLKGVEEGDFTFVMGFPGTTYSFLSAEGVRLIRDITDPVLVDLRELRTDIYQRAIDQDPNREEHYERLIDDMSNAYKKYRGRLEGFGKAPVLTYKMQQDQEFRQRIQERRDWSGKYGAILPTLDSLYTVFRPLKLRNSLFYEGGYQIEMLPFAEKFTSLYNLFEDESADELTLANAIEEVKSEARRFFDGYDLAVDATITAGVLDIYAQKLDRLGQPIISHIITDQFGGDTEAYARYVFQYSSLVDSNRLWTFLDGFTPKALQQDPGYLLMASLYQHYLETNSQYAELKDVIDEWEGKYEQAQKEVFPDKRFYPNANFTLRVAYGQVKSMQARDGVRYLPQTYLSGLQQKVESGRQEYQLHPELVEAIEKANTSAYANMTGMPVGFIATNHTTGGNSGSPVFNGKGQLIGLNFDRNYEGTLSDVYFDPNQTRNISLDVRYIVFFVEQIAKAERLLGELNIPVPVGGNG